MASEKRQSADPVEQLEALAARASGSDFFALVSQIERATPDAARVGGAGPTWAEAIRFRHDPSMAFSASDVSEAAVVYQPSDPTDLLSSQRPVVRLTTTFLGLIGAASPLPLYLASEIARSSMEKNPARDFLDIFHHRIISLFYRLWMRYQFAWEFGTETGERWTNRTAALAGVDNYKHPALRHLSRWKLLRVVPLLLGRTGTSERLRVILRECLRQVVEDGQVSIVQFVRGFSPVADEQRMRLGQRNSTLGSTALLGSRVPSLSDRFIIRIDSLTAEAYQRLVFEPEHRAAIGEIVALVVREPLAYDLELSVKQGEQTGFRLSRDGSATLGRSTWLQGNPQYQTFRWSQCA